MTKSQERALNKIKRLAEKWANEGFKDGELKEWNVEEDEYFDVMPCAKKASDYLLTLVKAEKMPRKLKVCFSSSKKNLPHATFRDLGFAANEKGLFDVYCCGGLGNNPRFGVKVAEDVNPEDVLYYVKAMRDMFLKHGNYENRAKARTRYMVEALGGEDNLRNEK